MQANEQVMLERELKEEDDQQERLCSEKGKHFVNKSATFHVLRPIVFAMPADMIAWGSKNSLPRNKFRKFQTERKMLSRHTYKNILF
jgi:hypothetical protein